MRRLILNFLPLMLGGLSNTTLVSIYRNPWFTQIFFKKSFKLDPKQKILDCLVLILLLTLIKADLITKTQSCNKVCLKLVAMSVYIKVILIFLGIFSMTYEFGIISFNIEKLIYTKLCYCFSMYLAYAWVKTRPHILLSVKFII